MPTIEGYRFAVSLEDRGLARGLRAINSEARTLKAVMRANFAELNNGVSAFSAYSQRVKDAQNVIGTYKAAIDQLQMSIKRTQNEIARTGETGNADAKITRAINTINRYKTQIANLEHQIDADTQAMKRAEIGIDSFRKSTEALSTATKASVSSLQAQGKYYQSVKANVQGLKVQKEALQNQLTGETRATQLLSAKQKELLRQYELTKARAEGSKEAIQRLNSELNAQLSEQEKLRKELLKTRNEYGSQSEELQEVSKRYVQVQQKVADLTDEIKKYKQAQGRLSGINEELGKNGRALANQAEKTRGVAQQLDKVTKASNGLANSKLGTFFRGSIAQIGGFKKAVKESFQTTSKWWQESKSSLAGFSVGLGVATAGMAKAVKGAMNVQRQYIEIKNLLVTSGESYAKSVANANKMQEDGIRLSQKYGFSQSEIAKQYEELIRRGYSGTAAINSMDSALKAARASGDSLNDVIQVSSSVIDAFGLRTDNASKMVEQSARVNNALASSADRTSAGFNSIGVGMTYVSATAKTVGWSLEETAAAIGELNNKGIEGSQAGTGLRKVITSLVKPTKGANDALHEAGLSIEDLQTKSGKLKSVDQIFKILYDHTKEWPKSKQGAFFKNVFGTTGVATATALAQSASGLEKNDQNLRTLIKHIKEDEGSDYVTRLANKNMKSAQMQIERVKQTAQAFELAIGKAVLPAVNKVGNSIAKWAVSSAGKRSIKEFSQAAQNGANSIAKHTKDIIAFTTGIVDGFKDVYHVVKPVVTLMGNLVGFFTKSKNGSQILARNLGRIAGISTGIIVTYKAAKVLFGGIYAIGKDSFTLIGKLARVFKKTSSEQKVLNLELKEMNALLKRSVELQTAYVKQVKEANKAQGNSDSGNFDLDDLDDDLESRNKKGKKVNKEINEARKRDLESKVEDAVSDAVEEKGGKSGKLSKVAEEAGETTGKWWQKGWLKKMGSKSPKVGKWKLLTQGSKAAEEAGGTAALGWGRKFLAKIGDAHVASKGGWKRLFSGSVTSAEEAGMLGGTGFIGKLTGIISKGATALGTAWNIASAGIDIIKGIRSHNPDQKVRSLGSGIGTLLGAGIGTFFGPAGTAIGGMIGGWIGRSWPEIKKFGIKLGTGLWNGIKSYFDNASRFWGQLFSGDFAGMKKGFDNFWGQAGDWFDKTFGVDNGKKKRSKPRKAKKPTVTQKIIKTGVKVSKKDVANVKDMSKALQDYAKSLKDVKQRLKDYDPSSELNKVNTFLKNHTKEWEDSAKPIKSIGDAFKYLAKFADSVAKKDAFAAFNKDLPKLDENLSKHGSSIEDKIKALGKVLGGSKDKKGNVTTGLGKSFESLAKSTDTLNGKLKDMNKNLKSSASYFKQMGSLTKQFKGKNNPLKSMADGFDKLNSTLKKDISKLQANLKTINTLFNGKKGKNGKGGTTGLADSLAKSAKPADKMATSFKSMASSVPKVAKSSKAIQKAFAFLTKTSGKGKDSVISKLAKEFKSFNTELGKVSESITDKISKIAKAFNGGKKGKGGLNKAIGDSSDKIKTLASGFKSIADGSKSLADNMKTAVKSTKLLGSEKSGLGYVADQAKKLYNTVNTYKFGSKIASQAKTASNAFAGGGKSKGFVKNFDDGTDTIRKDVSILVEYFDNLKTSVVGTFKSMWSSVKSNTMNSLNDMISLVGQAVSEINDAVDFLGSDTNISKPLKGVHYANGTDWSIKHPTLAVLNDGTDSNENQNREGLLHRNGVLEYLKGRNILRMLMPGDEVIKASDMARLPHYASGTKAYNLSVQERISKQILQAVKEKAKADKERDKERLKEKRLEEKTKQQRQKLQDRYQRELLKTQKSMASDRKKSSKKTSSYRASATELRKKRSASTAKLVDLTAQINRLTKKNGQIQNDYNNEMMKQFRVTLPIVYNKTKLSKDDENRLSMMKKFNSDSKLPSALKSIVKENEAFVRKHAEAQQKAIASLPKNYRKSIKNGEIQLERKNLDFSGKTVYLDSGYFTKSGKLTGKIIAVSKEWLKEYDKKQKEKLKKLEQAKKKRQAKSGAIQTGRNGKKFIWRTSKNGNVYRDYNLSATRRSTSSSSTRTRSTSSSKVSVSGSSTLNKLSSKISGLSKSITIKVKVSGAKTAIKSLDSLKASEGEVGHKAVDHLVDSVSSVNKRLKTANSRLHTFKSRITAAGSEAEDVAGHVGKAKSSVSKLHKSAKSLNDYLSKHGFVAKISDGAMKAKKALTGKNGINSALKKFEKSLSTTEQTLIKTDKSFWSTISKHYSTGFKGINKAYLTFSTKFKKDWSSLSTAINKTFSGFWKKMQTSTRDGLNKVLKLLSSAVGQVNKVIGSFGGNEKAVSKPTPIKLATGTGVFNNQRREITKPTLAMLNDGNDSPETGNKETIWDRRTNEFRVVEGRNTPFLLFPGQEVLNASESRALGFTHFASGTGSLKKLYELAKKFWNNPTKTSKAMYPKVTGLTGGLNTIAKGLRSKVEDQGTKWWSNLWKMVENKVNDSDDLGPASGLLKAVEELGKNKHYSQSRRMQKFFADCSSLVSRALASTYGANWAVPNGWALTVAGLWQHAHQISREEAKPGDPVFWLPDEHVGVYAGHGKYYSAYGPNEGGPVGMQSVAPGAVFGKFNGLNTHGDRSDKEPKVKTNGKLQKKIKEQVGKGFWKTIDKIADKYGEAGLASAFALGGDVAQRVKALAKALKQSDPRATKNGIAAIIGNAINESMLIPGVVNSIGARGLWQFYDTRAVGLENYARAHNKRWDDPATQINYATTTDTGKAIWKAVLEGKGSVSELALRFSQSWERGGHDAEHVARALQAAKILGYANGGIANKASIFGEAGPEMAIPLSLDKTNRGWELVGKTIAILSKNSNLSVAETQREEKEDRAWKKEVLSLLRMLASRDEVIDVKFDIDGRKVFEGIKRYVKEDQRRSTLNQRRGLSGSY